MSTRKYRITELLKRIDEPATCGEITRYVILSEGLKGNVAHYVNGSVSSILKKLVDEKVLAYGERKGPHGGATYYHTDRYKERRKELDALVKYMGQCTEKS